VTYLGTSRQPEHEVSTNSLSQAPGRSRWRSMSVAMLCIVSYDLLVIGEIAISLRSRSASVLVAVSLFSTASGVPHECGDFSNTQFPIELGPTSSNPDESSLILVLVEVMLGNRNQDIPRPGCTEDL